MWFNRIWSQDMLHQRTTAWNTQQHVADICLNQVMLVLLWLTDTDFFKNCQISILSSLRKWYLSAKYFDLFILLWLSGRRSDVKKWDCYLFYYRISHRQNYLHKKWSFMLAWQKKCGITQNSFSQSEAQSHLWHWRAWYLQCLQDTSGESFACVCCWQCHLISIQSMLVLPDILLLPIPPLTKQT